ncbi:J domain-containing protein [Mycena venus]|uniref:Adenine DNA glycosylase n=1 Tax=Mycena venus TaxID=2733690 RepID=A0A8H6XY39_9AGAR|nr:J domain-containing protein [Mycena venus]
MSRELNPSLKLTVVHLDLKKNKLPLKLPSVGWQMGKRKLSTSDSEVEFTDVDVSDDQLYVPWESKTRKRRGPSHQISGKRIRHDLDGANDVSGALPTRSSHAKSMHTMNPAEVPSIRTALVQWYSTVHSSRGMPWRKPYSPSLNREQRAQRAYEVWISEVMLQQTQISTVIPYYNRWLEKYPTIRDLADASIDEAVADYGGGLPDNAKDMQANIPGIGRYSAGAICSIAYGENVPVLDGNVNRLLSRFLALHAPPKAKATLDILWDAASAMVQGLGSSSTGSTSTEYPGDINQGLIELGSTVCKVRDPSCASCPLRTWCAAYSVTQTNNSAIPLTDIEDLCQICEPLTDDIAVTAYPMKADKKKAREELDIVNVIEWRSGSDRQFLLVRRPERGLLAGLDEFPTSPNVSASLSRARQLKIPQEILSNLLHRGVRLVDNDVAQKSASDTSSSLLAITKVQPAGDVVHVFSHIKKTYRVQWVLIEGSTTDPPQLASANDLGETSSTAKSKGKGRPKKAEKVAGDGIPSSAWVPLNAVAEKNMGTGSMKLYSILNVSKFATDAEIHERHRSLSLIFHPDKHHSEDSKNLATEKFLEVQKAYEVLSDPFLRAVYDSLGEPGLAVNWLEETRTKSSAELQQIFAQFERDWFQRKADTTISPRARVVCKVDASPLFISYQGLQDDAWLRRLQNRLEDVRVSGFSLRHDMQKRITERSIASLAARISRRGAGGRGNFIGTLRHQYSPRLAFEATSALFSPYDTSLRCEYQSGQDSFFIQTTLIPGELALPPVFISANRRLFRRPDSAQGRLKIDLGPHPQVGVTIVSQDPLDMLNKRPDHYMSLLPLARTVLWWSHGFVLNSYDPKLVGEWGLTLSELSLRCKIGIECGLYGLAWLFSGSWTTESGSVAATIRLSHSGVGLKIDVAYLQQRLSIPILLSDQHDSLIALWAAVIPSALCISVYHLKARSLQRRRLCAIRSALRALEPDSPARRDAEAVILFLKDKAKDYTKTEVAKGGLVILEATYGAMEAADRMIGLAWDVTIPLQTLVRGSQIYISGRHPKSSIQGFLDPAPFTLKSLQVRYLFRGRTHFAEVPEYLSLILPLADHVVN